MYLSSTICHEKKNRKSSSYPSIFRDFGVVVTVRKYWFIRAIESVVGHARIVRIH